METIDRPGLDVAWREFAEVLALAGDDPRIRPHACAAFYSGAAAVLQILAESAAANDEALVAATLKRLNAELHAFMCVLVDGALGATTHGRPS